MSKEPLYPHVPKRKEPLFPHVPTAKVTPVTPEEQIRQIVSFTEVCDDILSDAKAGDWARASFKANEFDKMYAVQPSRVHPTAYRQLLEAIESKDAESVYDALEDLKKPVALALRGIRESFKGKAIPELEALLEAKYPGTAVQFYGEEGVMITGEAIVEATGKRIAQVKATTATEAATLLDKELAKAIPIRP